MISVLPAYELCAPDHCVVRLQLRAPVRGRVINPALATAKNDNAYDRLVLGVPWGPYWGRREGQERVHHIDWLVSTAALDSALRLALDVQAETFCVLRRRIAKQADRAFRRPDYEARFDDALERHDLEVVMEEQ